MRKICLMFVVVALVAAVVPVTFAEEERQGVTQGELAKLLVKVLGLYRFLPANPSYDECFEVLLANKIQPADGWRADDVVTKAVLARVVVQSMERQGEVQNQEDPMSWIKYLESLGVPMLRVSETVDYLEPLRRGIAPNVFRITPDPLDKRRIYAEPDEIEYGADAEFIASLPVDLRDIQDVLVIIPDEPDPVTPTGD